MSAGGRTELGKTGKALQRIQPEATSLQKETARLVRTLAAVGLAACGLGVVIIYALTRGGTAQVWKEGLLAGIAMAIAILPEELPVVLTIFPALGAWRISRSRVLTRRTPAIETLAAATVLCVDKTGTLTQNQMALKKLRSTALSPSWGRTPAATRRSSMRYWSTPSLPAKPKKIVLSLAEKLPAASQFAVAFPFASARGCFQK